MTLPEDARFCPRCATPLTLRQAFGGERPVCPACGYIHFRDPKVAAAALIEQEGRVLLVRRFNVPQAGQWSLPAGFVDAGEDPAQAAARECLEECGLQVRIDGLVDVIFGHEHPRGADIVIVYHGTIEGGQMTAGDDADAVAFFAFDELPPLAFAATRQVLARRSSSGGRML